MKMQWCKRLLSMILILTLFVQLIPVQIWASVIESEQSAEISSTTVSPAIPVTIVGEEESLRTEAMKHFRLSDGSFIAVSYGMPVHHRDALGNWQDIDNTLLLSEDQSVYMAVNSQFATAFAANLSTGRVLTSSYNGLSVSMSLIDESQAQTMVEDGVAIMQRHTALTYNREVEAIIVSDTNALSASAIGFARSNTDSDEYWKAEDLLPENIYASVLYEDVYPGVDLLYTAYGYNVKEQIIVNEKQSAYRYDFLLQTEGLTAVLNSDSTITMADSTGRVIYTIPAPYMMDNTGAISDAVSYTLTQVACGYVLTVEANATWINADDRRFPVMIDPTLCESVSSSNDELVATYVESGDPDASHPGYQQLYFGYSTYSNVKERRLFMHMADLPDIPADSVVTDAFLGLYLYDYTNVVCNNLPAAIYEVREDKPDTISEYRTWIRNLTWNTQPAYDAANVIDYVNIKSQMAGNYLTWDITELLKKWYAEGTENRTFAMVMTEGKQAWSASYCAVPVFLAYASQHPPVIAVMYRNNTGIENYYTYATLGGGEAGTAYIADSTGQLKVAKGLVSYASTINPFAISLVYNSDYFAQTPTEDYQPPQELGLTMRVGMGWTLDVIQKAESVTIGGTVYIKYTDGDGTVHYFRDNPDDSKNVYYDEDGLGLEITVVSDENYIMSDTQGNAYTFTSNYLTAIADENGNQYFINYSNGKITTIQQKNNDSEALTVATFAYMDDYISSITDAAGIVYTLGYSDNKLVSISQGSTQIAAYTYADNRVASMADSQCGYSIVYTYDTTGKVSHYHEVGSDMTIGVQVDITYDGYDKTTYHDYGLDRTADTDDDIFTHYLFDYAGRTVNAYSTDSYDNIIGASNAIYTGTGSVDKTNNRTLRTASIGIAAEQELRNSGFESGDTTDQWAVSTGFTLASTKPHTGTYGLVGTPSASTDTLTATKSSRTLYTGQTYTLSAYVNTTDMNTVGAGGIVLTVTDGTNSWTSDILGYKTSENVENGWTRISVTFTAQTTVAHTVGISATGVIGSFFADDFQLERGEAPSNRNLLENGNFQIEDYAWTFGSNGEYQSGLGMNRYGELRMAPVITSSPFNANANISQTVAVNLPGTETYVLSGWSQSNAVPDNTDAADTDHAQDTVKSFGLRAILTYANGDKEYFYSSFNADIADWQFTNLTIVPSQPGQTVANITVVCAYEQNGNSACFDNISLVRQMARSMTYDSDGNVISASTTGVTADQNEYDDNGNLIKTITGTGGTIEYSYDETYEHRLLSTTNGLTAHTMTYDSFGNVISNILTSTDENVDLQMLSSSVYTNSGNLLESVTDSNGITVSYSYSSDQNKMLGLPSAVTDANGTTTNMSYDNFGRIRNTSIANAGQLCYTYNNGNLSSILRVYDSVTQCYCFAYDAFGNMITVRIDDKLLATYVYCDGNGPLLQQTFANGASITFTYDNLGRIKTENLTDGRVVTYTYNGEGQLYCVKETGGDSPASYYYIYDTVGRLVSSEKRSSTGESLMRVSLSYDNAGQLVGQTWNIDGTEYTEGYTYNSEDGTLNTMTTASGDTLQMCYDALRRISAVESNLCTKNYTYVNLENSTTNQVSMLRYTGLPSNITFGYTYDGLGNISAAITPEAELILYTYDAQGQLLCAEGDETYTYTYDTAGNILTANGHVYRYTDSVWKDLLTMYDGQTITYDASGNPLSYYNGSRWLFTWANGRNLIRARCASNGNTIIYTYNADGLRTSKTVNGVTHNYAYAGGKLLRETYGSNVLDFFYDQNGNPYALKYNGVIYYYITNLQGDVMYLVDGTGTTVASYKYDPFGNIISQSGTMAEINPLRYRGYYYDADTGFYYLQSRYYDPAIGRFINADVYTSTGQGVLGNNMFAYCGNNPANRADPSGCAYVQIDYNLEGSVDRLFFVLGGGSGGGIAYALAGARACARPLKEFADYMNCSNEAEVHRNLKKNGFAFYKGIPVFMTELPFEGSAFSFGIIVVDDYYKYVSPTDFAITLNHEYGHTKHMQQVGPLVYATTTAIPSLIFAGISAAKIPGVSQFVNANYYNLPWERIADYLGDVNRGYATGANTAGTLYWVFTALVSYVIH